MGNHGSREVMYERSARRRGSRLGTWGIICIACRGLWLAAPAESFAADAAVDIRRDATVRAIERVMPSVVNIATETVIEYHDWYDDLLRQFYGRSVPSHQQRSVNLGSGVIIDEEGHIVTNFHVVHRASRIQVKLWNGKEYEADPVVATQGSDVALLKIRAEAGEKFSAVAFARDDDLLLGETVLALGNPFGLGGSVTKGILSSKNRRPNTGNEPLNMDDWLQTDAAINPGNSGGPLVNIRGELIGLNVAVYREQDGQRGMGVGFSIPVKQVSAALARFFTLEVSHSIWFGAQWNGGAGPLEAVFVQKDGPAAEAGLKKGDRLEAVDGKAVASLVEAHRELARHGSNEVKLRVMRDGRNVEVRVRPVPFEDLVEQKLGISATEITRAQAGRSGLPAGSGLLIENVEPGSPAEAAQLQRGFVLAGIDGKPAADIRAAGEILSMTGKDQTLQLKVIAPRQLRNGLVELRQGTVQIQTR